MPVIKMLLQFLWIWMLSLFIGLFAAAWYSLSNTIMTYGVLLLVLPLVVGRFLKKHQRPFSYDEQYLAVVGLTAIILGGNLMLTDLLTTSASTYSSALYRPLPLSVVQGFISLQTPVYALISWFFVRRANLRFLARRHCSSLSSEDDTARTDPALGHHRPDLYNYPQKRSRKNC